MDESYLESSFNIEGGLIFWKLPKIRPFGKIGGFSKKGGYQEVILTNPF